MKLILWVSILGWVQIASADRTQVAGVTPGAVPEAVIEAEDLRQVDSPALTEAAESHRVANRIAAAMAYGRIQKPGGIDPLLRLLGDSNEQVQAAAIFNLGQFGWDASFAQGREMEIVGQLVPFLDDESPELRAAAVEAIGKLALEKTPSLIAPALSDESELVRAEALTALYRYRLLLQNKKPGTSIPDLPNALLDQVLALAKDSSGRVHRALAFYLSAAPSPRAWGEIAQLSRSTGVWIRYFATIALGKTPSARTAGRLTVLTQDREYVVRVAALRGLARQKQIQLLSEDQLDMLAEDPVAHVRTALATALGTWNSNARTPEPWLTKLLGDSSAEVRVAALQGLTHLKKDQVYESVKGAIADPNWVIREGAVEAAAELDAWKESLLLQGAQDSDVRVRFQAISELASVAGDAAFNAILNALSSDELSERYTAVDAIAARKETSVPGLLWQTYRRNLQDNSTKWMGVREEAISMLANIPGDATTQELRQAAASDADPGVVKIALQALAARGVTDLPKPLEEILTFSPYRNLRFSDNPRVILETTRGRIVIECYPEAAPIHVANFVGFARAGGYDGLPWHRVVPDFVVQGGDPDRTGFGDAGYSLRAEINTLRYRRGSVGMPRNDDFNTGGVQLFITHVPTPSLDGRYTIFGQVVEGLEILDALEVGDLILHAKVL